MNLARHAAVLWRFRAVTAAGLLLGLALAVLASYKVTFDGGPSLVARGTSTYNSESQFLVTQNGFPEGRVTLPDAPILGGGETDARTKVDPDRIEYGDPTASTRSPISIPSSSTSDQVRGRVPEKPKLDQIIGVPAARHLRRADPADHLALHQGRHLRRRASAQPPHARRAARAARGAAEEGRHRARGAGSARRAEVRPARLAALGTVAYGLDPRAPARGDRHDRGHAPARQASGDKTPDEDDDAWLEDDQTQPAAAANGNGRPHSPSRPRPASGSPPSPAAARLRHLTPGTGARGERPGRRLAAPVGRRPERARRRAGAVDLPRRHDRGRAGRGRGGRAGEHAARRHRRRPHHRRPTSACCWRGRRCSR